MQLTRERVTLVQALCSMADLTRRAHTRRFLEGLSTDELEYIAEYIGCRLLDPEITDLHADRNDLAVDVERFQFSRPSRAMIPGSCFGTEIKLRNGADAAHKMILLLEYLSLSELGEGPVAWSGQGSA